LDVSRVYNKWPLAKEGLPFVLVGCTLTSLFLIFGFQSLSILLGVITLFIIFFFRDPNRKNVVQDNAVLTPADGTVVKIQQLHDANNHLGEPAIKISIFMSIFNVHVNRIPVKGSIQSISYQPGKFFSANLDKASEYNENNKITLETADSHKIVFVQIAGLIARRIVCWIREQEHVDAGQRFGLIRFGSRLDVYLPADSQIIAEPHQKMKAGETIIGYLS
jgi:phosphatidylserine decarboxylase